LQDISAEAQNPSVDQRLEREQSLVVGRQRHGLSITDSLTGAQGGEGAEFLHAISVLDSG
jgi:hypothetical protein